VFGAYVTDAWQQVNKNKSHYGSGETFLFKVRPDFKVYKWAKTNDYFMLSGPDFIAVGGGGDGFGLWLDSEFLHGNSQLCETFLNEPLASTVDFRCLKLEVWGMTSK